MPVPAYSDGPEKIEYQTFQSSAFKWYFTPTKPDRFLNAN
jgi:hypothetical protein